MLFVLNKKNISRSIEKIHSLKLWKLTSIAYSVSGDWAAKFITLNFYVSK